MELKLAIERIAKLEAALRQLGQCGCCRGSGSLLRSREEPVEERCENCYGSGVSNLIAYEALK